MRALGKKLIDAVILVVAFVGGFMLMLVLMDSYDYVKKTWFNHDQVVQVHRVQNAKQRTWDVESKMN